jgi:hypothetical protein
MKNAPIRPRRSLRRLAPAATTALVLLAAPASALADEEGGGLWLDAFATFGNVDDFSLHSAPAEKEPDPLKQKNLLLDGPGAFVGGGFHFAILGSEMRGGGGMEVFGMEGMKLKHDRLPQGLSAKVGSAWGVSLDFFLGRELVKGPVYPYIDLRAVVSIMQAGVELHHEGYGFLGETYYNAYGFGVGPRLGVAIPLSDPWVIDISAYYGLFGAERATIVASLGFWDR